MNKPVIPPLPNSPEARDIAHLLHPYTDAHRHAEIGPLIIDKGDGIYVEDVHGNRFIEAMAGLWSVGLGFGEKRLVGGRGRTDGQAALLPSVHAQVAFAADRPRRKAHRPSRPCR